jgi:hypothetical protein
VVVNQNVALGFRALFNIGVAASCDNCVAVGQFALANLGLAAGSCSNNIGIGTQTYGPTSGNGNVIIGHGASGSGLTNAGFNTFIGYNAGSNLTGSCNNNLLMGGWLGPSHAMNDVIALSGQEPIGRVLLCDYNYIKAQTWSFQYNTASPIGIHVYNTLDNVDAPANYERGCLDWNLTSNVFRLASQAGGTGVMRLIAIDGFQKAGAPAAGDLPSGTMALINDTSGGQTWLAYNAAGTVRKVQLT